MSSISPDPDEIEYCFDDQVCHSRQQEEASPMNRPAPEELISAYFDGELTPEERQQADNLLESSDELRQLLDDTSKLSALLHSFPRETAPAELAQSIQKKTDAIPFSTVAVATSKRPSHRREWMSFGAGAFVTVATLLLVYFNMDQPRGSVSHFGLVSSEPVVALRQKSVLESQAMDQKAGGDMDVTFGRTPRAESTFGESLASSDAIKLEASHDAPWASRDAGLAVGAGERGVNVVSERGLKGAPENRRMLKSASVTNESRNSQEFLESLKDGDLVFRQVVDANDAVAVVEFRVVDVDKAVDGIKLLLQKRHVQKVEEQEALGDADAKSAPFFDKALKQQEGVEFSRNKFDDLIVVYVRAPGDRLADTIKESLKDHPEIYKSFEAQSLIGLPGLAQVDTGAQALAEKEEMKDIAATVPTVSDEAKLALDSYATSNGLATSSQNAPSMEYRLAKRNVESNNPTEGYATFRVPADQQRKVMSSENLGRVQQQVAAAAAPAAPSPLSTQIPLFQMQNSLGNSNSQFRFKTNRTAADQRESRLVRMLIVLKPESSLATP